MEGAVAYLLGKPGRGLKQMMDQVNLSRLSHGFRAAGMMRRCLNEAMQVARHRRTFGRTLIDHPLGAPAARQAHAADRTGAVGRGRRRRGDDERRRGAAPHPDGRW